MDTFNVLSPNLVSKSIMFRTSLFMTSLFTQRKYSWISSIDAFFGIVVPILLLRILLTTPIVPSILIFHTVMSFVFKISNFRHPWLLLVPLGIRSDVISNAVLGFFW